MRFWRRHDEGLESEMRDHLEREIADNVERGMSPSQARTVARRKFGSATMIAEDVRAVWFPLWLDRLWQDVRSALRLLHRHRSFTVVAVLSMALGIAGTTVILAILDGVVFNPLAIPAAERVVGLGVTFPRLSGREAFVEALSLAEYRDIASLSTVGRFAVFDLGNRNISGGDRPERVMTGLAVTDPFSPFALAPALGRGFAGEELRPGGPTAAILSHRLWRSRFNANPRLVGNTIRVNGRATTVVGIMPPELLILGVDLWIPWGGNPAAPPRSARQFTLIGRLDDGATLDQANAELAALTGKVGADHGAEFPEYTGWRLHALPWAETLTLESRGAGRLLLAAAAGLLLIACANLSNLLVAHATTRRNELAVRMATGATPLRLARQLLTETTVLTFIGAAVALLVASPAIAAAMRLIPPQLNAVGFSASLNGRVLLWSIASTTACALLAAMSPLIAVVWPSSVSLTASARGTTASAFAVRLRRGLAAGEIALAVALLCGAVLLTRSVLNAGRIDVGFDTTQLLTMRLTLPQEKYRGDSVPAFFEALVDKVSAINGVTAAGVASQLPPQATLSTQFQVDGAPQALPTAAMTVVSHSLFTTLGVPVVRGRLFDVHDRANTPAVVIVNETFAAQYLPGLDPVGRRLLVGPSNGTPRPAEIVGVVRDTRNRGVRVPPVSELFVPAPQIPAYNQLFLIVRTTQPPASLLPELRTVIAGIDPDQPVYFVQTMTEAFGAAEFRQRASSIVLMVFAGIGLALAGLGIYGVVAYGVSSRAKEFAVRQSLGAGRSTIGRLVLRDALGTISVGVAVGLFATIGMAQSLRSMLLGVAPSDPLTLAIAIATATTAALLACAHPTWRAVTIDPATLLKAET